jgi:hypothetical protein
VSGIFGFVAGAEAAGAGLLPARSAALLERMAAGATAARETVYREWLDPHGRAGIGLHMPATCAYPGNFAVAGDEQLICAVEGRVFDPQQDPHVHLQEAAAYFIQRYQLSGTLSADTLLGGFNVALWDGRRERLLLANDRSAHNLLFVSESPGLLLFSSAPAGILASGAFAAEIDVEALAELSRLRCTIGGRTLFRGLQLLPPSALLR